MNLSDYKAEILKFRNQRSSDKVDADSLVRKPKSYYVSIETREQKQARLKLSDSIEDIFERAHCMGFMSEDDVRRKMQEISSFINRPR